MGLRRVAASRPLIAALVFEALLIPPALVLALLLDVHPWTAFAFSAGTVLAGIAATVPLVAVLSLSAMARADWLRELEGLVRPLIDSLFRGRGPGAVVAVSALAGFGEELLFRGVVQAWLVEWIGPPAGVALAAVVFGLAHCLSRAYFVLATAMGLYLGVLYEVSDDLVLTMVVHGLYDALAIGYLLYRHDPV